MPCGYTIECSGCKACEGFCQDSATTHSYHQKVSAALSGFSPSAVSKDDIIIKLIPKATWTALVDYVNQALALGNTQSTSTFRVTDITGDFLTAEGVNSVVQGLSFLNQIVATQSKDQVIYAQYITALLQAVNNATFGSTACHRCNTTCNSDCVSSYQVSVYNEN